MHAVLLLVALTGCTSGGPFVDPDATPPKHLSRTHLFQYLGDGQFEYAPGIVPYDVNTPLYSDGALKDRAMFFQDGAGTYEPDAAFDLPVGTVLIKSFSFAPDLRQPTVDRTIIETRLLVHGTDGWVGWPYVWNDAQTDATLQVGGAGVQMDLIDIDGQEQTFQYRVPQKNQCQECHLLDIDGQRAMTPIGIKARHLHRGNTYDGQSVDQLQHLADLGDLDGLPDSGVPAATDWNAIVQDGIDNLTPDQVTQAARDWLDINCAHCHNPHGVNGITSQLFLNHDNTDAFHLGVCKRPGSAGPGGAGRTYDIVPGDHEASILWYRMSTTEVGAMMPPIGRSTALQSASDLIARWIDQMSGSCDSTTL